MTCGRLLRIGLILAAPFSVWRPGDPGLQGMFTYQLDVNTAGISTQSGYFGFELGGNGSGGAVTATITSYVARRRHAERGDVAIVARRHREPRRQLAES